MLFNSIEFAFFLPVAFLLYWFVFNKKIKTQNFYLLIISYVFYGWWDWRFLSLIAFSSSVDFFVAKALNRQTDLTKRKLLLSTSLIVNLGLLGFFKYYDFFVDSFVSAYTLFGQTLEVDRLNIILPVGISFYTFQTLSYSVDIYRRKLKPEHDPVAFFAFVSFFPQLVAGPIERARDLLPQFKSRRKFDYSLAVDGVRQILWGLFKKIVISGNCALIVDQVFENHEQLNSTTLLFATFIFTIQCYADFSGYSDIAIGTAKLFGFRLTQNFAFPLFSRDVAEFWRKWHISLYNWCKDYIYIPLGGNRRGKVKQILFINTTYVALGFWHGANLTFILFGLLNGLMTSILVLTKSKTKEGVVAKNRLLPSLMEAYQIITTFLFISLTLVLFRSASVTEALSYYEGIFSFNFSLSLQVEIGGTLLFILLCFSIEWLQRGEKHALQIGHLKTPLVLRYTLYLGLVYLILRFGANQNEFLYFQF